jgi:hypothetical protein
LRICAIASSSTSTPSVQSLISAIPSLHRRPHLTLMRAVSTQSVSFRRRSRIRSR